MTFDEVVPEWHLFEQFQLNNVLNTDAITLGRKPELRLAPVITLNDIAFITDQVKFTRNRNVQTSQNYQSQQRLITGITPTSWLPRMKC